MLSWVSFCSECKRRRSCFTDPKELIRYLNDSDDAEYMWSDSEDLVIIADMYQVIIKIITTKGSKDSNPSVNWIHPDKDMEKLQSSGTWSWIIWFFFMNLTPTLIWLFPKIVNLQRMGVSHTDLMWVRLWNKMMMKKLKLKKN